MLRLALDARPWLVKIDAQEVERDPRRPAAPSAVRHDPATDPIDDGGAIASGRALAARTGGAVIVTRGRAGAIAIGPTVTTGWVGRTPRGATRSAVAMRSSPA